MELEHINENTVKLTIEKSDLDKRGLTFFDLVGSPSNTESFFYSLMDEAGIKEQFSGIDAVTFQVVPLREGFELYITKGITQDLDSQMNMIFNNTNRKKGPLSNVIDSLKSGKSSDREKSQPKTKEARPIEYQVYQFKTLNDFLTLARELPYFSDENHLYLYKDTYYFSYKAINREVLEPMHYKILEYANKAAVSDAFLRENGKVAIENDAITIANKYFRR